MTAKPFFTHHQRKMMHTSKQHLNQATAAPLPCPTASIGNPAERAQESHPVTEGVSRDFSKIALAAEIVTALTYDDRKPPRWHGHVGHAEVNEHSLLITRSYASPREGANQERLVVSLTDGRVHLRGFDEGRKSFSIQCPLSPEAVLARMHGAAVNGIRSAASLVVAIRTGNTSLHHEGDELHFEF